MVIFEVLDRLPGVGDVDSWLLFSFTSLMFGAVKMDWESFIEPAAKALEPPDEGSCGEERALHCCGCMRKEGVAHDLLIGNDGQGPATKVEGIKMCRLEKLVVECRGMIRCVPYAYIQGSNVCKVKYKGHGRRWFGTP